MDSVEPEPDSISLLIFVCIILILLSAFFSATETAFSSVNKTKLRTKAQEGDVGAKRALDLAENFDKVLSSVVLL